MPVSKVVEHLWCMIAVAFGVHTKAYIKTEAEVVVVVPHPGFQGIRRNRCDDIGLANSRAKVPRPTGTPSVNQQWQQTLCGY